MAKVCHSCGKKPSTGNKRSHSMRASRRRWEPNLQKVRIKEGGSAKRVWVCTSCLKAFKVQKAISA
jgi:large subunit ribosomal protein L28